MKKILSLALATLMTASVLASCATAKDRLDPAITLASSDAYANAQWLDERLDTIPDDVVVGIGSNEAYGVDMADFEADGYIVREMNGEVLIFGASADGLDRAVRKYAKAAEINQTANLDEVYHEGVRVKKLTIGGHDISEYSIYYADTDSDIAASATELSRLLKKATGVDVPVVTTKPAGPIFELKWVTDESLGTVGYRYSVTEDGVLMESSDGYRYACGLHTVWRFLEHELDWFSLSLMAGDSNLTPSDHVDIPAGTAQSETPAFAHFTLLPSNYAESWNVYKTDRSRADDYFGTNYVNGHGIQAYRYGIETSNSGRWAEQPCYTDEYFYECSLEDIIAHIESKIVSGQIPGENLNFIDIGIPDNPDFCICESCREAFRINGSAQAGAYVRWANRVSEAVNTKYQTNMKFGIFAYSGTNRPPRKDLPNEYLTVCFCYDFNCSSHPLDGSECNGNQPIDHPMDQTRNSGAMTSWLKEWIRITEYVNVYPYWLPDGLMTIDFLGNARQDLKFLHEIGVKGIHWEGYNSGYDFTRVAKWIGYDLLWDIDMSDEEYQQRLERIFKSMFGEGWENIYEYHEIMDEAQRGVCGHCWMNDIGVSPTFDIEVYAENYDRAFELIEEAITLAESALQERWLNNLSCSAIYKGSLASYFQAYDAYDEERLDVLRERYSLIDKRLSMYGLDMTENSKGEFYVGLGGAGYKKDLDIQAWDSLWGVYLPRWFGYIPVRTDMPEHVAEYMESMNAASTAES